MNKHILKLNKKQKGFPLLRILLKRFSVKDKVVIKPFAKDKTQLPNRRFFGKIGEVVSVVNNSTIVVKIEGTKKRSRSIKYITTSNLHLKKINIDPKKEDINNKKKDD